MCQEVEEFQELIQICENVRRNANALELCDFCQMISECRQYSSEDDGFSVWVCERCLSQILSS